MVCKDQRALKARQGHKDWQDKQDQLALKVQLVLREQLEQTDYKVQPDQPGQVV